MKLSHFILDLLFTLIEEILIFLLIMAIMFVIGLKAYQIGYHYVDGFWDNVNQTIEEQRNDPLYKMYNSDEN